MDTYHFFTCEGKSYKQYLERSLIPPKESPDPVHSVNVSFDKHDSEHPTSPINQQYLVDNIVYSAFQKKQLLILEKKPSLLEKRREDW